MAKTSMSSGPRCHAEGGRECRGLLCVPLLMRLFDAAAAPPGLMKPAGSGTRSRRCSRRSALTACLSMSQLDEQPVRVGLLQSKAVELLQALGGLLDAEVHATQELPDPLSPWTDVQSLIVEPLEHSSRGS